MSRLKKPDFICIGPEKTGTTWLYAALRSHPDVALPPCKELRYFNEGNLIPKHSLCRVFFSRHWHYANMRRRLVSQGLKLGRHAQGMPAGATESEAQWGRRYVLSKRSLQWYESLFCGDPNLLAGDISPLYYYLKDNDVRLIAEAVPSAKILIFYRNPAERVWSKAVMNLCVHKNRPFETVAEEEFITYLEHIHKDWIPYKETLSVWRKYFDQVSLFDYDLLKSDPHKLLHQFCDYLSLDHEKCTFDLKAKVNKGLSAKPTARIQALLERQYVGELVNLEEGF